MSRLFLYNHLGLGDHIVCLGLYRSLATRNEEIVIPVRAGNFASVRSFMQDLKNVRIIGFPNEIAVEAMKSFGFWSQFIGYKQLKLGHWGSDFMNNLRFDQSFYSQARVLFENRWSSFTYQRNELEEKELMDSYNVTAGSYIFLHEDLKRNFVIDRSLLPSNLQIVEPRLGKSKLPIATYRLLIEKAAQIHMIESSFAAFSESFDVDGLRFAHRYARPEASRNPLYEFTYAHKWHVFLKDSNKLSKV